MTDTPRTDSHTGFFLDGSGIKKGDGFYLDPKGPFVFASFARELEMENKTLKAQVALDHRAKGLMLLESCRQIDCILFVYSRDREIKCFSADEARDNQKQMFADGWKHTSTIHPARWIEALINHPEGLDAESTRLMDELQFGVSALPNV